MIRVWSTITFALAALALFAVVLGAAVLFTPALAIEGPPTMPVPAQSEPGTNPQPMPLVLIEPPAEILAWGLLMLHRGQVRINYYYNTEQVVEICTEHGWTDHPDIGCYSPVDATHCDLILNNNLSTRELHYATEGLLAMCAYHWYAERWPHTAPPSP